MTQLLVILLLSSCVYSQDIKSVTELDTVYLYFKEDGKFQVKNDKYLPQKMITDSIAIYEYNSKGTGGLYNGEFGFINKNYNEKTLPISKPLKIKKRFLRQLKDKLLTADYFKKYGYTESYFSAIDGKKALYIIEEKKDGKLVMLEVQNYFGYPYEQ